MSSYFLLLVILNSINTIAHALLLLVVVVEVAIKAVLSIQKEIKPFALLGC